MASSLLDSRGSWCRSLTRSLKGLAWPSGLPPYRPWSLSRQTVNHIHRSLKTRFPKTVESSSWQGLSQPNPSFSRWEAKVPSAKQTSPSASYLKRRLFGMSNNDHIRNTEAKGRWRATIGDTSLCKTQASNTRWKIWAERLLPWSRVSFWTTVKQLSYQQKGAASVCMHHANPLRSLWGEVRPR